MYLYMYKLVHQQAKSHLIHDVTETLDSEMIKSYVDFITTLIILN